MWDQREEKEGRFVKSKLSLLLLVEFLLLNPTCSSHGNNQTFFKVCLHNLLRQKPLHYMVHK